MEYAAVVIIERNCIKMMKPILTIKEKITQKLSEHNRYMTLGKLDSAGSYKLTEEEARQAALKMLKKSRKHKMHFVYGHSKLNENGEKIGTIYYFPISFTRRQYILLAYYQILEYDNGTNNYYIYAEHRGNNEK